MPVWLSVACFFNGVLWAAYALIKVAYSIVASMVLQRTDLGKKGNGETEKLKGFNSSQQSNQFQEPKYEQNYKPHL